MTQVDPRFYDEILPRLWRGGKWGYYWSNDDGEGNKVTVWKNLEENSSPPVTPAWLGKMNCYYGIHPTKQRGESSWARAKIADIACINCLYAEIDGIESDEREAEWIHWLLNDCAVRPSLIIFSGGGLHVYWLLEDTFWLNSDENLERAIVAQKAIVARIGGDTSVHDLARVLRVAGTINHKPGRNSAVVTIRYWEPEETYFLEEIEQRIPEFIQDVQKKRALVAATSTQFESLGLDDQNVLRVMFGAKHGEEYRALWNGDTSCVDGDLSRADQKLLTGLAWATGCDASQMERLFRASSIAPTPEREKAKKAGYVHESIRKAINTTTSVYNPAHNQNPMMIAAAESVMQNGDESHASGNESHASGNSEPSKPPPPNSAGVPLLSQWEIHTAADALEPVKPLEYLIEGFLAYPSLNTLYGGPGSLKTMILEYLAACVASGSRFLDVFPLDGVPAGRSFATVKNPVLWVDFDNGKRRTQARLGAMLRGLSLTRDTPLDYVSLPVPHLDASQPESIHNLALLIKSKGYKLIIVDNLGLITGDVEENSAGMASVMGRLRWLVEECNCALILIHHQRKSASNGDANGVRKGETLRGHSSIEAALDLALVVERKPGSDEISITPTKVRDSLDFDFISAKFIYELFDNSKDMKTARFYSLNTKSRAQVEADQLEDEIIETVRMYPGIGHQKLADVVKDALAAQRGRAPGINIIRGTITDLATKTGKLRRDGNLQGFQYFIP